MPKLTFMVPTHREDRPLRRCLDSIAWQMNTGDELVVVGDTHDGPLPSVEKLVENYHKAYQTADVKPSFRYLSYDAGHHCWGHCQLNWAMPQAKGDYIHLMDDDDVWLPEAAKMIRQGIDIWPGRPLLFRFQSQFQTVYWVNVGQFERNIIGGHCLVLPNVKGKLGKFGCEYSGDFDWLESAVGAHGGPTQAIWLTDIIARARP